MSTTVIPNAGRGGKWWIVVQHIKSREDGGEVYQSGKGIKFYSSHDSRRDARSLAKHNNAEGDGTFEWSVIARPPLKEAS